ncbi:hypothetical protein LN042_06040 [Kitasatospora sp. RB6PN24]|uniref:hypothetical protein n=1 Tax=Kitasatospora humi TaxID=2893891 RepID=UPI001E47E139|nr:hypothetical protein [Kitasatospora humi]MCC9306672.1 hypothetical protein [Kitasatospora humi]
MAGDQTGQGPVDEPSGAGAPGLTGGLSGGEWWQAGGPGRSLDGGAGEPADDGVYLAGPAGPVRQRGSGPAVPERPGTPPSVPVPSVPVPPGAGRAFTAADFPGWDAVTIDFPFEDDPEDADGPGAGTKKLIPSQRTGAAAEEAAAGDGSDAQEPAAARQRSFLAGRRPSPLLLLAALVLVGGAVTGLFLVLLIGWGLVYLSKALGDLTKKFAVFGIPLVTMSTSTLWYWGRAQGNWGAPLASGSPMTHAAMMAAPAVLRIAAVGTALFVTAIAMRRRRA